MKYRSTITIYSDFDAGEVELSTLAREAEEGSAICTDFKIVQVPDNELPESATSFFDEEN